MLYSSAILLLAGLASAQVAEYGQCGGKGWSGSTTCQSPYTCQYQNDWYSQCLPGTGSGGATTTTTTTTTAKTTVTTTSVKSTTTAPTKTRTTTSGPISTSTGFAHTNGLNFTIDGETSYFAGSNSYWIGFLTNNADVDLVMQHLSSSGLRILRVWGFNDVNTIPSAGTVWFQHLAGGSATINTGADGLQRLDYVVSSAEKHGIKLIINFVNNWSDYGGINAYVNAFGGSATTWYTNTAAQTAYKNYIKAVVSRYISSPAVFAWELANEPRCKGCDTSVIYDWVKATSQYIKSLDPKHMVTIGDEGFGLTTESDGSYPFSFSEGLDFSKNLGISTIDFGTFHLYPSSWGTSSDWGNLWVKAHGDACAAAGKPCLFEEYGYPSDHCTIEAAWQKTALNTKGVAADLYWQYGDTLSYGQTSDDGYTIYYGSSDFTCLVTNHVAAI